jgi:photosystem II stability/assembly factor-like uncharacterized protein
VGRYYRALRWNGQTWSRQRPPNPRRVSSVDLFSVSCTSSEPCTAVGDWEAKDQYHGGVLTARWNGASWAIQRQYGRPDNTGDLVSISCVSPNACIAVGDNGVDANGNWLPLIETTIRG